MAKPCGDDLRRKFLSAYDQGEQTLEGLTDRLLVSVGWAKKISAQRNRSGRIERVPHRPGRKWQTSAGSQRQVMDWAAAKPDLTLTQLTSVEEAGSAAEKKSLHAVERDTETNRGRRTEFASHIRSIPPERLIFLDERGVTTSMTGLYARGAVAGVSMRPRLAVTGN